MRFGKTFTSYHAKLPGAKVLALTFKPAGRRMADRSESHVDFDGWRYQRGTSMATHAEVPAETPLVYFGSFRDPVGAIRQASSRATKWIHTHQLGRYLDEYHFGAWRDGKGIVRGRRWRRSGAATKPEADLDAGERGFGVLESEGRVLADHHAGLPYLSGTPSRFSATGEFIEEQIFN